MGVRLNGPRAEGKTIRHQLAFHRPQIRINVLNLEDSALTYLSNRHIQPRRRKPSPSRDPR